MVGFEPIIYGLQNHCQNHQSHVESMVSASSPNQLGVLLIAPDSASVSNLAECIRTWSAPPESVRLFAILVYRTPTEFSGCAIRCDISGTSPVHPGSRIPKRHSTQGTAANVHRYSRPSSRHWRPKTQGRRTAAICRTPRGLHVRPVPNR